MQRGGSLIQLGVWTREYISEENTCIHMLHVLCPGQLCEVETKWASVRSEIGLESLGEVRGLGNYRGTPGAVAMLHMY